jgi:hypothetical protein
MADNELQKFAENFSKTAVKAAKTGDEAAKC